MNISIFGAGYVGVVSAACLARDGHHIIAVEPKKSKVEDLNQGRTPIREPEIGELIQSAHGRGRLRATSNPNEGVQNADMVWICVGTPSQPDGGVNLDIVETAARQIGQALKTSHGRPLIVVRSTCPPGSTTGRVIPILEQESGLAVGKDIQVVFHPEFLREGTSVYDFNRPPKIVVGEAHEGAGDVLFTIYEKYDAPRFRLTLAEAEMVKYCDNLFHAVKVTFANEIGMLAKAMGVDARRVADVFLADTKLNISPRYLRPGFAFGGSCLPKDTRAILRKASELSVRLPMLEGTLSSNTHQIESFVERVLSKHPAHVGMIGLAFKPCTDDMRESPYLIVAKRLIGEGVKLSIYDPYVDPNRLVGSNQKAVKAALRHLEPLLVGNVGDFAACDLILINHRSVDADQVHQWLAADKQVIDLVHVPDVDASHEKYEGIAW